jgi:hypothetical protein
MNFEEACRRVRKEERYPAFLGRTNEQWFVEYRFDWLSHTVVIDDASSEPRFLEERKPRVTLGPGTFTGD